MRQSDLVAKAGVAITYVAPILIAYLYYLRNLKGKPLWVKVLVLPVVYIGGFIVVGFALLVAGVIPFQR